MSSEPAAPKAQLSVRGAIVIGVGAMVGAGIFALLGEAGAVAGSATWVSFLLAGTMTAALGYALVKFAMRWPSSGGIIVYLQHGYRSQRLIGTAAWLGYLTTIVVVCAMVASSFGDYLAAVIADGPSGGWLSKVCAAALVVGAAYVTLAGPRLVDRFQTIIVGLLLVVFAVFVVGTFTQVDLSRLAPSTYPGLGQIIASIALTFFAFLGFAVITFAGGDLPRPKRDLPIAMYASLAITTILYVLVSLGVFGTLPVDDVVEAGPRALAVAAQPALGQAGYVMMTVAALLATSSSVTSTLYGARGLTEALATSRMFPPAFGPGTRLGKHGGLVITAAIVILFVTVLDVSALASIGSGVSLAVFLLVAVAALRLRTELNASPLLTGLSVAIAGVVLVGFVVNLFTDDRRSFWFMIALVVVALVINEVWTRRRGTGAPATTA